MGDRAVVSNAGKTADARFLDGYCQEAAEDSFYSCASVVVLFELIGSIRDLIADVVGYTPEVVAAFLAGEFGMSYRTEEKVFWFRAVKERASVLEVSDSLDGHTAMAVHGKIGWADYLLIFAGESIFILSVSWIVWDEGPGLESVYNVFEDRLGVVFRVAGDGLEMNAECLDGGFQQGNSQGCFSDGVGFSDFPER